MRKIRFGIVSRHNYSQHSNTFSRRFERIITNYYSNAFRCVSVEATKSVSLVGCGTLHKTCPKLPSSSLYHCLCSIWLTAQRTARVTYVKIDRSDAIIYKLRIAAEFLISSSRCELIYKFEFLFEKAAMSCKTTLIVYFD